MAGPSLIPGYRHCRSGGGLVLWQDRAGCALALGDPLGDPAGHEQAIGEFLARTRTWGSVPAFVAVSDPAPYRRAGLRVLPIGLQARIALDSFARSGRSRRSLRNGVNRARRAGLRFELAPGDRALDRLQAASEAWLSRRRLPERRFGTGQFDRRYLGDCRVASVHGRSGRIEAFTNLLDTESGVTLDLFRRRPDAPPGTMDLLLVGLAEQLAAEGCAELDLGLAPLAGLGSGGVEGFLGFLYRHGRGVYDFQGLHRFKAKFQPRWERRFLAYPTPLHLPRILVAMAELSLPRVRVRELLGRLPSVPEGPRTPRPA